MLMQDVQGHLTSQDEEELAEAKAKAAEALERVARHDHRSAWLHAHIAELSGQVDKAIAWFETSPPHM